MFYRINLFVALFLIVSISIVAISSDRDPEERLNSLHYVFSKGTGSLGVTELLREAAMVNDRIRPGIRMPAVIHLRFTLLQPDYIIDVIGSERSIDVSYKLSKFTINEEIIQEPKISKSGEIIVNSLSLKPGNYDSFDGPYSKVIFNENRELIAVCIEDNFYITTKAEVTNEYRLSKSVKKLSGKMGAMFHDKTLEKGYYKVFNGPDAAFLFNSDKTKDRIVAILIKEKEICNLYIATIATVYYGNIGPTGLPKSLLDIGHQVTTTALVGPDSVIIVDKNGKPIDTSEENDNKEDTGKDGSEMVLIPAGEFQMGDALDGRDDALPVHTVYLDAFYMDVHPVTNAQYKKFLDATGYKAPYFWNDPDFNKPDHPVVGVSWHDASAYAKWVGKRLPHVYQLKDFM